VEFSKIENMSVMNIWITLTILDSGYWILDAGYWMLDSGCWILDSGCLTFGR